MKNLFNSRTTAFAVALLVGLAPAVLAQSTMIKGKVVDGNKQHVGSRRTLRRARRANDSANDRGGQQQHYPSTSFTQHPRIPFEAAANCSGTFPVITARDSLPGAHGASPAGQSARPRRPE